MVVLDSHAVVWWASAPKSLSARAAATIAGADRVGVPSIVFWEISLLVRKRKLDLGMPVAEWASQIEAIPRVASLPLTTKIALLADTLDMHADPADRFIVATAVHYEAPLVTKDTLLRPLRLVRTVW